MVTLPVSQPSTHPAPRVTIPCITQVAPVAPTAPQVAQVNTPNSSAQLVSVYYKSAKCVGWHLSTHSTIPDAKERRLCTNHTRGAHCGPWNNAGCGFIHTSGTNARRESKARFPKKQKGPESQGGDFAKYMAFKTVFG